MQLDLSSYAQEYAEQKQKLQDDPKAQQTLRAPYMYDLYAVIIHVGTGAGRGHYHAYIRDFLDEVWLCCEFIVHV